MPKSEHYYNCTFTLFDHQVQKSVDKQFKKAIEQYRDNIDLQNAIDSVQEGVSCEPVLGCMDVLITLLLSCHLSTLSQALLLDRRWCAWSWETVPSSPTLPVCLPGEMQRCLGTRQATVYM